MKSKYKGDRREANSKGRSKKKKKKVPKRLLWGKKTSEENGEKADREKAFM